MTRRWLNVAQILPVLVAMTAIRDSACGALSSDADKAARQLGIPDGTARSRLHYALHALRQHLHGHAATAT
jgi:hypothetical protein